MEEEKTEMTPETKPQPKGVLHMEKDGTSYKAPELQVHFRCRS